MRPAPLLASWSVSEFHIRWSGVERCEANGIPSKRRTRYPSGGSCWWVVRWSPKGIARPSVRRCGKTGARRLRRVLSRSISLSFSLLDVPASVFLFPQSRFLFCRSLVASLSFSFSPLPSRLKGYFHEVCACVCVQFKSVKLARPTTCASSSLAWKDCAMWKDCTAATLFRQ